MIDFDQSPSVGGGGVSVMVPAEPSGPRSRFRSRLHTKGGLLQPLSPNTNEYLASSSPRSTYAIGELNRRITDLKVDNPALSPPLTTFTRDTSPKLLELGQNYMSNGSCHYQPTTAAQYNQQLNQQIRRDSNNSTTSSSYYSMKSCDISRRSSQQSHTSSMSTIRPANANYASFDPASFYDPISAGSSRRSSQLSSADYGPPSSQLLSSHLARLQRHSGVSTNHPYHSSNYQQSQYYSYNQQNSGHNYGNFFCNYNQNVPNQMFGGIQTPSSSTDRRMSEPISNASRAADNSMVPQPVPRRPRSTTPTKSLEMLLDPSAKEKDRADGEALSPSKPHPNETVVLDVLKTNEKIENCDELVIPDEMVMYLNQVGDDDAESPTGLKIKLDLESEPSISIEKIKEEDLFSLLTEVKPDELKANSEINNNKGCDLKTESLSDSESLPTRCKT
jgi:transcriptional activator cubitus interruptus